MATTKKATKKAAKRRVDTRFKKGNTSGQKFKKGKVGGPGRPPNLGSPRAQLKRYVEEVASDRMRARIKKVCPELDADNMTWAEVIAVVHILMSAEGDLSAIAQVYKQVDDSGANKSIHAFDDIEEAAREFTSGVASLAAKLRESKGPI